ncbi:MAG: universal stress protein, partial [Proteobacteria bacterium]|nr:universal stress protein [Pseudomonadota bacterium]
QETILKESEKHDLVVMGTSKKNVLKKLFFGSLVETVSRRIRKPLLIVYRPANEALLADRQLR